MSNRRFWIKLDGEKIKNGSVEISLLADNLLKFNRLVKDVVSYQGLVTQYHPIEIFSMFFVASRRGSYMAGLEFKPGEVQQLLKDEETMVNPIEQAEQNIQEIFEHISNEEGRSYFLNNYPTVNQRVAILKKIQKLCPKGEISWKLDIEDKIKKEIVYSQFLTQVEYNRIQKWIKLDAPEAPKLVGAFRGFKAKKGKKYNLFVTLLNGEQATCSYKPEMQQIIEQLNCNDIITFRGIYEREADQRKGYVDEISELSKMDIIQLEKIGNLVLSKPLEFSITWEEEMFFYRNSDLGLVAFGETEEEAMEEVSLKFSYLVDEYLNEDDEKLTLNAKELKQKLRELLKTNKRLR